jgi:hypothetical protein
MRTVLLLAVFAVPAALTSTADAQWLRVRRTSECANGQCGVNATGQVDSDQTAVADQDDAPQTHPVEQTAASEPVAAPTVAAEAADVDSAAPIAAPATRSTRSSSISPARSRTVNAAADGQLWRRLRSRS